jgi:2-methylaconitate cis-trans-isomerase PrpF
MRSISCTIMRGGTSKAVFVKEEDLPASPEQRKAVLLSIFGSPDERQIDGLGGADPLTSKLAIIGPPGHGQAHPEESDLSYTFGQVEINRPEIDFKSLCGNITSAVGVYAIEEHMLKPVEPITIVRIHNTNLNRLLTVEVPVAKGKPLQSGDYSIPGVPGTGAKILVNLAGTAGGATGSLLPTGNPVDDLDVPGFGKISASLVDIGNAHVFIRAQDVGLTGIETADEMDRNRAMCDLLERIRGAAAMRMKMVAAPERSREESPATPILGFVSPPRAYHDRLTNTMVCAEQVDVISRLMFMQRMHKTYAGTSTICTGVASRLPGSVVHRVCRPASPHEIDFRIGHPRGVISTEVRVTQKGTEYVVERATLSRTARRIMEGRVFIPDSFTTL